MPSRSAAPRPALRRKRPHFPPITGVTVDGNDTVERDRNGNPVTALGALTLDLADGAQLTVPPVPVPGDSWDLSYCYDWPDSRIRPRLRLRGIRPR